MTLSKYASLKRLTKEGGLLSFREDLIGYLIDQLAELNRITWPSVEYQRDPLGFFRNVLGIEPWQVASGHQGMDQLKFLQVVQMVALGELEGRRFSVSSGHKVGKSNLAAGLALWFFCSFPDAQVIMTSTTAHQIRDILWREVTMLVARARVPIGSRPGITPTAGLNGNRRDDFRKVTGFTAKEAEGFQGISGAHVMYLIDEASGVSDRLFEIIEGSMTRGTWVFLFGNPTRNEGEHFLSHHDKKRFYHSYRISTEDSARARDGKGKPIPGFHSTEWVKEKEEMWGRDSAQFKVRILGEHATVEERKCISLHVIWMAEQSWSEDRARDSVGRLQIGIDVAGPGGEGDEWVFTAVRGDTMLAQEVSAGLTNEEAKVRLVSMLQRYRKQNETPVVVPDNEGRCGSEFYGHLKAFADLNPEMLELWSVKASGWAAWKPEVYERIRDEMWGSTEQWLKDGGAIITDQKLSQELHAPEWREVLKGTRSLMKATPRDVLRRSPPIGIGRSPDRATALGLAVYQHKANLLGIPVRNAEPIVQGHSRAPHRTGALNPYLGRPH